MIPHTSMRALFALLVLLLLTPSFGQAQDLIPEEAEMYRLLMNYRAKKGLPSIPISPSLLKVARAHVVDLAINKPDLGECNAHSWSAEGDWTACCYTSDHAEASCMWNKPREISSYTGDGFEISSGSNGCCSDFEMTPAFAVESWQKSAGHNAVILNKGMWRQKNWAAIGIGIHKGFAVVWFGEVADE